MSQYILESPDLYISFSLDIIEEDIQYPINTTLSVQVKSNGFTAISEMDIDIKKFRLFINELNNVYKTLKGTAIIQEPYGQQQFIKFSGDNIGFIHINGKLCSDSSSGFMQELSFENSIDQTFLPDFINKLSII